MALGFPAPASRPVNIEVHISPVFDHVVACAPIGITPGELYYPHAVAVDPSSNYIYVAEGNRFSRFKNTRVSIFSDTGEYLNGYTHEHMMSLWGIAIHGNNLYVTDWEAHAVFHLMIKDGYCLVDKLGSRGSGIEQFDEPRQLAISTSGDLYIADSNNDRILILDPSLHPIREVAHPSMHRPCDVKLRTEEIYVLSLEGSFCVHVFTDTGLKIFSLIRRGDGMPIYWPLFFCLNANKELIIGDEYTHQIKVYSNEGVLLQTLGEHGHQVGMFNYPQGLALTSNLKLVTVSMNNTFGLQIFSFL